MARVGLSSNRKFLRLARALDHNRALARGVLELLWEPCYEVGEPYIGTSDDIEAVVGWKGPKGLLTKALLAAGEPKGAGFIEPYDGPVRDRSEPHYQVHDFYHHCPEYARTRREREAELTEPKVCEVDGTTYYSRDPKSRFCSPRCRQRAYRSGNTAEPFTTGRDAALRPVTQRYGTPTPRVQVPPRVQVQDDRVLYAGSSATQIVAEPSTLLTFPTVGTEGHEWLLTQAQVDQWLTLYPGLAVVDECRKALSWISADLSRRKTPRGMPRFLVAWLNRATDRGAGRGATVITGSLKTAGNQEALERFVHRQEGK